MYNQATIPASLTKWMENQDFKIVVLKIVQISFQLPSNHFFISYLKNQEKQ